MPLIQLYYKRYAVPLLLLKLKPTVKLLLKRTGALIRIIIHNLLQVANLSQGIWLHLGNHEGQNRRKNSCKVHHHIFQH